MHVGGDRLSRTIGNFRRPAFYRLVWSKATQAAGLEVFPFRNLRHTGATLALQESTNPVLVAFRLGQASTAMIEHSISTAQFGPQYVDLVIRIPHNYIRVTRTGGDGVQRIAFVGYVAEWVPDGASKTVEVKAAAAGQGGPFRR